MMRRQVPDESPTLRRRQPLLSPTENGSVLAPRLKANSNGQVGEWAGGAAAVCCCCPCTVVNLVLLAVYKVPSGLCRKALRNKRRKRLMKKKAFLQQQQMAAAATASGRKSWGTCEEGFTDGEVYVEGEDWKAAADLEKEMWQRFYGAGFWRSPSQRED